MFWISYRISSGFVTLRSRASGTYNYFASASYSFKTSSRPPASYRAFKVSSIRSLAKMFLGRRKGFDEDEGKLFSLFSSVDKGLGTTAWVLTTYCLTGEVYFFAGNLDLKGDVDGWVLVSDFRAVDALLSGVATYFAIGLIFLAFDCMAAFVSSGGRYFFSSIIGCFFT